MSKYLTIILYKKLQLLFVCFDDGKIIETDKQYHNLVYNMQFEKKHNKTYSIIMISYQSEIIITIIYYWLETKSI